MIEGKSSLGRLGISAHVCAGFGDLGFAGHFVLEIVVVQPTKIYPNMKIGQIAWHTTEGLPKLYEGKYQQQKEIIESKSFKDFK
jgi:dCTP deaminase